MSSEQQISEDGYFVQLHCMCAEENYYDYWAREEADGEVLLREFDVYPGHPRCLFEASLLNTEPETRWYVKEELRCFWCGSQLMEWDEHVKRFEEALSPKESEDDE